MTRRPWAMATAIALGLAWAGQAVLAAGGATAAGAGTAGTMTRAVGTATAPSPHEVTLLALPDAEAAHSKPLVSLGVLSRNGARRPAHRPDATKPSSGSHSPSVTTPMRILQNFAGTRESQSCLCSPPDSNGAVNGRFVVETDNLSLQVWSKGTPRTLVKRVSYSTFLSTTDALSDPRVLYDNRWNRWVMVITVVPTASTQTPALWLAASQTSSPAGKWWLFRLSFTGAAFPRGVVLDYPMVGMDADAVVVSTDSYQLFPLGYAGSHVFAAAKTRLYDGLSLSVPSFVVGYASHPAFVEGIPQQQDAREYLVGSQVATGDGSGFDIYYMTNSSRPDSTAVTFAGSVPDSLAPTRPNCASQPGGGTCLDTLDGRLQAAPRQLDGRLWFARTVGYPLVEFGYITPRTLASTTAVAFTSHTSNDWNPSIGVSSDGAGSQYVFLNWAFTDPVAGVQVSTRVAGLGPADPVQDLVGVGTTLATGGHGNDFRFGDYSSVSIDPTASGPCVAGRSALVVNEEFDSRGRWQLRDARVGFC